MVDAQTLSIVFAGLSLGIAAFYYSFTLRINQRNNKIALTNSIMQTLLSEEAIRRWIDLMKLEWTDYDDFERKYGSDVNPDNYTKRMAVWTCLNVLGHLLRNNVADAETFHNAGPNYAPWIWEKFKPVLLENRRRYGPSIAFSGLEYLAEEMMKITRKTDPSYEVPKTFSKYIPDNEST